MGKLLKDALLHRRACTGLRLAAEKSIACLLPPGDTMFASRLKAALLNGANVGRRVPLARLLAQAAGVGNSNMLASLKRGLRHSTCDVRISAAAGLGELAQKGDRQTINALVSALDSTELWGCGKLGAERDSEADAIASALARLSPTGDRIALEALRRKLLCNAGCDIPSFDAGIKAIHVLAQGTGDGSAISALLAFLGCRPYWQLAGLVERPQGRIYGPTTCRLAVDAICEIAVPNCDGQVVRAVGERVTTRPGVPRRPLPRLLVHCCMSSRARPTRAPLLQPQQCSDTSPHPAARQPQQRCCAFWLVARMLPVRVLPYVLAGRVAAETARSWRLWSAHCLATAASYARGRRNP